MSIHEQRTQFVTIGKCLKIGSLSALAQTFYVALAVSLSATTIWLSPYLSYKTTNINSLIQSLSTVHSPLAWLAKAEHAIFQLSQ